MPLRLLENEGNRSHSIAMELHRHGGFAPWSWIIIGVLVVRPSAVSSVTFVGVSEPTKKFRTLQMLPVADLSITKGIPSESHEIAFFVGD